MSKDTLKGFQDADHAADSENLFRFLDAADSMAFVQVCKRQMLDLCPVQEGHYILDVGCGVGHEVQRMAQGVGQSGRVVGIDHNESMIAEAQRRAKGSSFPVEFYVGDAERLDFDRDSFDLSRSERVIEYLENPQQMLAEMVRVVRPGGAIINFDFDYDGFILDAADRESMRRMKQAIFDSVPSGGIGSQLPRLYHQLGMQDIQIIPQVFTPPYFVYERLSRGTLEKTMKAEKISTSELEAWWRDLEQANQDGRFFAAYLGFIVSGRKP